MRAHRLQYQVIENSITRYSRDADSSHGGFQEVALSSGTVTTPAGSCIILGGKAGVPRSKGSNLQGEVAIPGIEVFIPKDQISTSDCKVTICG